MKPFKELLQAVEAQKSVDQDSQDQQGELTEDGEEKPDESSHETQPGLVHVIGVHLALTPRNKMPIHIGNRIGMGRHGSNLCAPNRQSVERPHAYSLGPIWAGRLKRRLRIWPTGQQPLKDDLCFSSREF